MTKIKIGHYNNRNDKKSGHYVKEITKDMVWFIDLNQKMNLSDDTVGMEKNKYVNSFINELGYTHRGVWVQYYVGGKERSFRVEFFEEDGKGLVASIEGRGNVDLANEIFVVEDKVYKLEFDNGYYLRKENQNK